MVITVFKYIYSGIMLTDIHDLFSNLLREYSEVWRPRRTSQKGLYEELVRRLKEKLNHRTELTRRSTPSEMLMTPESRNETRASMLFHNFLKDSRRKAAEAASRRQSHGPKRARLTEEDDFSPAQDDFVPAASRRQSHGPTRAQLTEEDNFAPVHVESSDSPPMSAQSKFDQLSEKDKIVQIHFDEVYTNHATVVLVFAARSLLTCFNIVLNSYPRIIAQKNMEWALEENVKATEELELDVRAIVCDRNAAN
uniref:Uncharacterized protein n=1 Tax=Glossina palpalis gambiensis TaxID=67801 RepID=A0A1B0BH01_9MUSC